jgi:hypothetical protein
MRIQVHVDDRLGEHLARLAASKGISLNNEVRQRLGASLARDNAELLVQHIAESLRAHGATGDTTTTARAIVALVQTDKQPR